MKKALTWIVKSYPVVVSILCIYLSFRLYMIRNAIEWYRDYMIKYQVLIDDAVDAAVLNRKKYLECRNQQVNKKP